MIKTNIILQGDALTELKKLPDECINCCMTSPPYWALRDYGVKGQLGLEKDFNEYINKLCNIFDEVKRVLRKDGTCWVNMGDTYGGTGDKGDLKDPKNKEGRNGQKKALNKSATAKSLCMIPERFAIEMINRGWILRNKIIWYKRNAMPCPVKDRFTVDYEMLFFFTKSKKYWFETQYESVKTETISRNKYGLIPKKRVGACGTDRKAGSFMSNKGRNKRAVWDIPLKGFREAHFATYPESLCEIPIKSGCPIGGIVLDPFFGSGTTGVVALKQKKKFIGIELNNSYCDIAKKRLEPYLSQKKIGDLV